MRQHFHRYQDAARALHSTPHVNFNTGQAFDRLYLRRIYASSRDVIAFIATGQDVFDKTLRRQDMHFTPTSAFPLLTPSIATAFYADSQDWPRRRTGDDVQVQTTPRQHFVILRRDDSQVTHRPHFTSRRDVSIYAALHFTRTTPDDAATRQHLIQIYGDDVQTQMIQMTLLRHWLVMMTDACRQDSQDRHLRQTDDAATAFTPDTDSQTTDDAGDFISYSTTGDGILLAFYLQVHFIYGQHYAQDLFYCIYAGIYASIYAMYLLHLFYLRHCDAWPDIATRYR
jgi:hypothetical protein